VLQQDAREFRLLTSLEEKKALLLGAGVDRVEVLPFTRAFAALTAAEYLALLRDRFGASLVVMGYDNRIGSDRKTAAELAGGSVDGAGVAGGAACAPEAVFAHGEGFSVLRCANDPVFAHGDEAPVSSTRIRKALKAGDVVAAAGMLGYQYGLYGVVVAGNRLGRTIGFPTANMQLYEPLKLVPGSGVYVVDVELSDGRVLRGMTNIGIRPTVGGTTRTIETHVLDFDEDIYGLPLRIRFLRRLRDERPFPSLDALRAQLEQDRTQCQL
jgi:riboflavin kinase/FMN adenylyltransferase